MVTDSNFILLCFLEGTIVFLICGILQDFCPRKRVIPFDPNWGGLKKCVFWAILIKTSLLNHRYIGGLFPFVFFSLLGLIFLSFIWYGYHVYRIMLGG